MSKKKTAWHLWLESREGHLCADITTLPANDRQYLENRLWRAFDAGRKAILKEFEKKGVILK